MHPQLLGLGDENLDGCLWLVTSTCAEEARAIAREKRDLEEIWVSSTDEVSALNLAAAIHKDRADVTIMLIASSPSGSFLSNATAVGASDVLTEITFEKHFAQTSMYLLERQHSALGGETAHAARKASLASCVPEIRLEGEVSRKASKPEPSQQKPPDQIAFLENAPTRPQATHHALPSWFERASFEIDQKGERGLLLPIMSGSGGSGKSTIAAVLAMMLADRGIRTAVLDLDLQFGDMGRLLGPIVQASIDDVLSDASLLDSMKHDSTKGKGSVSAPVLIAAPKRLEQAELIYDHVGEVIERCLNLFDVLVVNTGSLWGEHQALLLERSPSPIFLIDQRASSVFACKHALELCARMGIATRSFLFALNRCARDALFTGIDIAIALQGVHVVEIKDGGHEVEELLGAGMASELCATKNEMLKGVSAILDEIALPHANDSFSQKGDKQVPLRAGAHSKRSRKRRGSQEMLPALNEGQKSHSQRGHSSLVHEGGDRS